MEILWEVLYSIFRIPLILIAILLTIMGIGVMLIIVGKLYNNTMGSQLRDSFNDNDCLPYISNKSTHYYSLSSDMLEEQLELEDEERYLGMDYGFLDEVDHLSDY